MANLSGPTRVQNLTQRSFDQEHALLTWAANTLIFSPQYTCSVTALYESYVKSVVPAHQLPLRKFSAVLLQVFEDKNLVKQRSSRAQIVGVSLKIEPVRRRGRPKKELFPQKEVLTQ